MASAPKGLTADNTSASRSGVRTTSKRLETAELLAVPGDRRRCAAAQKASRARRAGAALWLAGRLRLPQTVGAAFQPAPHLGVEREPVQNAFLYRARLQSIAMTASNGGRSATPQELPTRVGGKRNSQGSWVATHSGRESRRGFTASPSRCGDGNHLRSQPGFPRPEFLPPLALTRSEERRVGKECRYRWAADR